MLLFIDGRRSGRKERKSVSIHPMLLFIENPIAATRSGTMFQYIPCYSLSYPNAKIFSSVVSFNTSHVTLYLRTMRKDFRWSKVSIHPMLLFIAKLIFWMRLWVMFQYIPCYSLSCHDFIEFCFFVVSIHPMLLFIWMWGYQNWLTFVFQYIPCYSLSIFLKSPPVYNGVSIHPMLLFIGYSFLMRKQFPVSIHPMLLFIRAIIHRSSGARLVSIHPMLLFICDQADLVLWECGFNTSHVTLYQKLN